MYDRVKDPTGKVFIDTDRSRLRKSRNEFSVKESLIGVLDFKVQGENHKIQKKRRNKRGEL